jgi:outer membrane protein assembly factor BamD (BamD/ComL family)
VKNKQSLLFILVGIGCATLAVLVLRKYMGGGQAPPPPPSMEVLVAARNIDYGELLVLGGEQGNVVFAKGWPKGLQLEGMFTSREAFNERDLRAVADLVKHQPILEGLIVDDDEFIPPDMTVQILPTEPREVRMSGVKGGMHVDIYRIVNQIPRAFMKNARVYAVGRLNRQRKPVKENNPPATVHILVKKEDELEFRTGVTGKKFSIIEAEDPGGEPSVFVDAAADVRVQKEEAQAIFDRARALMRDGDYEGALDLFRRIADEYSEVGDLAAQAGQRAGECIRRIAEGLYGKAERVYLDGNYALALEFLDEIERDWPEADEVVQKARQLQVSVQQAVAANRALVRYRAVLADTDAAFEAGNLPKAEELLDDVEAFDAEDLPDDAAVKLPAEAAADYRERLAEAEGKFKIDRAVVEAHVKQNNTEQARRKLEEMRAEFPAHPDIEVLEELVNEAGT